MPQKILYIPNQKAGLIIGRKGRNLREKNDDGTYSLTITAMNWLAVERVKQEINELFEGVRYSGNMLPLTPEKELALRARMGPLARRDIIQEIFRRPT